MRTVRSYVRWAVRAKPGDYVIALGAASASVPLVGRHLEVLAGFAALGVGGRRYVSSIGVGLARARLGSISTEERNTQRAFTPGLLSEALDGVVSAEDLAQPWPVYRERAPFLKAAGQRRYVYRSSVRYGDRPSQLLDVWRSQDPAALQKPAPVLVFGSRELQGHALMAHLVRRGWVCLSIQYGSSPRHRWPRQITDVKAAIAWARANAEQFGGDPSFVAVAGCSAGGHLATLAGLTNGDPQWQAELHADADTSVDAVVSVYGLYHWHDKSTAIGRFLHHVHQDRRDGTVTSAI
ncbi:Esterase/lipase (fragment) [uncultured Mycobacterium sp.]|uniref:Esterase/lipase n=1 Tax=uncultured Mycobacterium sp. TaxID=171292 RepID=A0A1Y5PKE0_9MYCO